MTRMAHPDSTFEQRKRDHLEIALKDESQSALPTGLSSVVLTPEALPDLNFSEIDLKQKLWGTEFSSPLFVSSMTAGHQEGRRVNAALARLSQDRAVLMGVGSQRGELEDPSRAEEWALLRRESPGAHLVGNLGIAQLIRTPRDRVREMMDRLGALGLFIHLNGLQECLQPEGTPEFKGSWQALEALVKELDRPIVVKEVGCGFSAATLKRLSDLGVFAVDISGRGGTHWGRVEAQRLSVKDPRALSAPHFSDWGLSTVESMVNAKDASVKCQVWASGGVRSGLDVAKLIAMGATMVGAAKPWLSTVMENPGRENEALHALVDRFEFEMKTALFCTGCRTPEELRQSGRWSWQKN